MVNSWSNLSPPEAEIQRMIDAHTRWLETGGLEGAQIGSCEEQSRDFRGLNLDGIDLSLGALKCFDFSHSSLRATWFIGADLDGVQFNECDLTGGARFDGANITAAVYIGAEYRGACFDGANMRDAIWTREQSDDYDRKMSARLALFQDDEDWERGDRTTRESNAQAALKRREARNRENVGRWFRAALQDQGYRMERRNRDRCERKLPFPHL